MCRRRRALVSDLRNRSLKMNGRFYSRGLSAYNGSPKGGRRHTPVDNVKIKQILKE